MERSFTQSLVASGLVTLEQIQECMRVAQETGARFEKCLLEKGYITPQALAKAYASYAGFDYIEKVTDKMADLNLLAKIPLKFLRDNEVIPLSLDGAMIILTSNPFHFQPLDEVNIMLGGTARYAVSTSKVVVDAINRYYPIEGTKQMIEELEEAEKEIDDAVSFEDIEEKDIMTMAAEAPIIKLVNRLLFNAVKQGASDIHIEPFEKELNVRYRVDGILYHIMTPPKRIQGALISRIKIMAHLNIAEKRIPQDGRIDIRVASRPIDIRVSIIPVTFGERVSMRLLDKTKSLSKLEDMGFSERDYKVLREGIAKPNGIIYITGPTGSGKTTTLYAILADLNKPDVNILTVEDPVEYQMPGVGQVQVKEKIGLTFAAALRAFLRQDPDIIMIGETRDPDTAQIAIQAALTGHLVFSTLHTNSAPASITRLLDMGVEPYLIVSSIELVMAQRLVRRLCDSCKEKYAPTLDLLKSIGLTEKEAKGMTFYRAKGCDECSNIGYKGRLAIYELMTMTDAIARLTMARADTMQIRSQAVKDGMTLLVADGLRKIKSGLTTIDEVLSVASIEQAVVE